MVEMYDLSVIRDREVLERFLRWINTWYPKRKGQVKPIFDYLNDSYPIPGLWDIVIFR